MDEEHIERLLRRTLGEAYLTLEVVHYLMTEYVRPEARCRVVVTLRRDDRQETVEGQGVGFVEAAYRGLVDHYGRDFESLSRLRFVGFEVEGRMETGSSPPAEGAERRAAGLDAQARVTVGVCTLDGERVDFAAQARSTLAASLRALVRIVERFTNAETAARALLVEVEEARCRGRVELLATRRAELASLRPLTGPLPAVPTAV